MAFRYQQAAQSGDDDAQFYLGALYSAGVGVQRSDEEAFRWLSRATDHGHIHAMLILAGLCAVGRGAPQDNVSAYKWAYIVAYASRVDEFRNGARQLMGVLETRLTPDQVYAAKTDASRWHAVPIAKPVTSAQPAPAPAPTIANASPQPAAPSPQPQPQPQSPAKVTVYPSPQPVSQQPAKKSDADNLLDQVPQGLRKKFGF